MMSSFIEGLLLFSRFTLDLVIRGNKLFLEWDVTKLSGTWNNFLDDKAKIEINKIN